MSDDKLTYEAQTTTPEQDKILAELNESLTEWLRVQVDDKKIDHSLLLTALMVFTSSAVSATDIPKEAFVDLMGRYYDIYRTKLKAQS